MILCFKKNKEILGGFSHTEERVYIPGINPGPIKKFFIENLLNCEVKESYEYEQEISDFSGFSFLESIKKKDI